MIERVLETLIETVIKRVSTFRLAVAIWVGAVISLGACGSDGPPGVPDDVLKERVEAALASASDVPADALTVEVSVSQNDDLLRDLHQCAFRSVPGWRDPGPGSPILRGS